MKFSTLFTFALIFLLSCSSDPCEDKLCGDFGECNLGLCVCDTYYEGDNCENEIRARYIGNWTGESACADTNTTGINFEITAGVEVQSIKIQSSQIYSNIQFVGTLDVDNNVTIPRFQGPGLNFFSGRIEELGTDRIKMTIDHETGAFDCIFTLMR